MKKPYQDNAISANHIQRTFAANINADDLVWHRDKQDRLIKVVAGNGWQLQLDNKMPFVLHAGLCYIVPKMLFHRVLKGDDELCIEIFQENI